MFDNLKNWFARRVVEPSTMAGLAVVLALFFPGEGEAIKEHLLTLFDSVPDVLTALAALAAIFMGEGSSPLVKFMQQGGTHAQK